MTMFGMDLLGEAEARLHVGVDGGMIAAGGAVEVRRVAVGEDGIRHVSLGRAGEAAAGNDDAVERDAAA